MRRRDFLRAAGAVAALPAALPRLPPAEASTRSVAAGGLAGVRGLFELDPSLVHLGGLYLASHPRPVREAVARYRDALDRDPVGALHAHRHAREEDARRAAAAYLGAAPDEVALTFSTTSGMGLVVAGLDVAPGRTLVTARTDFPGTHAALRTKAARTGAVVQELDLYEDVTEVTAEGIVARYAAALDDRTRLVVATWVQSASGLKLPLRRIADVIARHNRGRGAAERALLLVDGVHGLGVEPERVVDLGCDLFVAGTHKWVLAPRGTGVAWARADVHDQVHPTIPTFTHGAGWGGAMSPGGFHAFEHRWAMPEAFALHDALGRQAIADHVHALVARLKAGLDALPRVALRTPRDPTLSAGLVCFDVAGLSAADVVQRLRERGVVATATPYRPSHARLTPGVFNTERDVDRALSAVAALR